MRTKENINLNQCEGCGQFVGIRELECCDETYPRYEGMAFCKKCFDKLKEKCPLCKEQEQEK
jgi:hypothetical protein